MAEIITVGGMKVLQHIDCVASPNAVSAPQEVSTKIQDNVKRKTIEFSIVMDGDGDYIILDENEDLEERLSETSISLLETFRETFDFKLSVPIPRKNLTVIEVDAKDKTKVTIF